MSRISFVATILLGMVALSSAFGIGRTGNGSIISTSQGFQAEVPGGFENSRELSDQRLQLLSGIPVFGPQGLSPMFLELSNAGYSLPVLADLSRKDLDAAMLVRGWTGLTHTDPCVAAYFKADGMALAAFWGGGKGLVAVGPSSFPVQEAEKLLLGTLQLLPGACAW